MAPEGFAEFFLATAGAGAAIIGLLFVAITIGPERTFGVTDRMGPQQHLAEATLLTMVNGFVVCCVALIPTVNVGWVALVGGVTGVAIAINLIRRFAEVHRHGDARRATWTHLLRVASVSLVAVVIYAIEAWFGFRLIRDPGAESNYTGLALVVIGLYALATLRAWTLLGDPQHGWSGWLNPLQDLTAPGETEAAEGPSS